MERTRIVARKSLAPGELLNLAGGRGLALEVHAGMVWLTMPNGPGDVLIEQGGRVALAHSGLALAEAVGRAEVSVVAEPGVARSLRAIALGRLADRLRRWLRRSFVPRPRMRPCGEASAS